MQQATSMLREFVQRMDIAPAKITEWAQPHLENLGNTLLGVVPPCGFPDEQKRIVAQYQNLWPVLFLTFPLLVWLIDGAPAQRWRGAWVCRSFALLLCVDAMTRPSNAA
jgi:hypothetical protein